MLDEVGSINWVKKQKQPDFLVAFFFLAISKAATSSFSTNFVISFLEFCDGRRLRLSIEC